MGLGYFSSSRSRSRRLTGLTAGAAIAAAVLAMFAAATPASAATALRTLAEAQGRYIGTEVTGNMVSNATITNIAGTQFDMVTRATR